MIFFYNLILALALVVSSPYWMVKAVFSTKWRSGLRQRLGLGLPSPAGPVIWLHAASVGEARMAVSLIKVLKERKPGEEFVLSVITNTGYDLAVGELGGLARVVLAPIDLPGITEKFIGALKPKIIAFIETELWPNLIAAATRHQVKLAIINGRLSDKSFPRYYRFRKLFQSILTGINVACVQTETDRRRFAELGVPPERIRVCSSLKYDLASLNRAVPMGNFREFALEETDLVWTAGSTRNGEEELVLQVFSNLKKSFPGLKLILAPRHLERVPEVEKLLSKFRINFVKKSSLPAPPPVDFDCLLLDKMGELTAAYGVSTVVFVGGSLLDFGGQNIIEPAALAKPVIFGPYVGNFKEIAAYLLSEKAALQVGGPADLEKLLAELLNDPARIRQLGEKAKASLRKKQGALLKNVNALEELI